jgi:hypothetical protein
MARKDVAIIGPPARQTGGARRSRDWGGGRRAARGDVPASRGLAGAQGEYFAKNAAMLLWVIGLDIVECQRSRMHLQSRPVFRTETYLVLSRETRRVKIDPLVKYVNNAKMDDVRKLTSSDTLHQQLLRDVIRKSVQPSAQRKHAKATFYHRSSQK